MLQVSPRLYIEMFLSAYLLILLCVVSPSVLAQAPSPRSTSTTIPVIQTAPSEIILVYPDADVFPSFEVQLGVRLDVQHSGGLNLSLDVALLHFNGTLSTQFFDADHLPPLGYRSYGLFLPDTKYVCTSPRTVPKGIKLPADLPVIAESVFYYRLNYTGIYMVIWNLTYGTYPHPDQATRENRLCGPGPMSSQSFLMNRTFSVDGDMATFQAQHGFTDSTGNNTFFNHTTSLTTQPTGLVWRPQATSDSSAPLIVTSEIFWRCMVLAIVSVVCLIAW